MSIAKSKQKWSDDMKFLDAKGQQETFDTEQKHFNIAFNADCMNFMKNIPDNYFSLCVVDPPYGGGCSQNVQVERERERERRATRRERRF